MELLHHRVGTNQTGQPMLEELKAVKNVALVWVRVTIPAGGAQQGDNLDCTISAISAKSLEGGDLMLTDMHGPDPKDETIYGIAKGQISLDDPARPQVGRIALGCQLEKKIENQFVKDGKLTLVMNKDHAAFQTTSDLEAAINQVPDFSISSGQGIAKAIDQVNIEVTIPRTYADNSPLFASRLLETRYTPPPVDTRVIINERKQIIIVGADVEIGAVAVMHKNRLIQIGNEQLNQAVAFDPKGDLSKPKLASLVDALNELRVPTADVIDIIKLLKHKRALFGELIIE
jgi:flagellar P-ring protein precursor FlgI